MGARHKTHPGLLGLTSPKAPQTLPRPPTPRPVQPAIGGERDWRTLAQMSNSCKLLARVSPTGAADKPERGVSEWGWEVPRKGRAPTSVVTRRPKSTGTRQSRARTHTHSHQPGERELGQGHLAAGLDPRSLGTGRGPQPDPCQPPAPGSMGGAGGGGAVSVSASGPHGNVTGETPLYGDRQLP